MMRSGHMAGVAVVAVALSLTGFTIAGTPPAQATPSPPVPGASHAGTGGPHWNTGATHSPRLLQELAGPLSGTGMPAGSATHPRGVDVADYQHPGGAAINWGAVFRAGYRFAAVKATEGTYYVNPWAAKDVIAGRNAGLYMTYYHFAIPNGASGAAQADYAVRYSHYAADGRMLPFMLDIEYDPYSSNECYGLSHRAMVAWIAAFSTEIKRLTGQYPIIFTTAGWWQACTGGNRIFGPNNPLWDSAWRTARPPLAAGWRNWTFWQFISTGTVPGILPARDIDLSYFNGAVVTLIDPGNQGATAGRRVSLQIHSLNAAVGEALSYRAAGLPPGLTIDGKGVVTGTAGSRTGTYRVTVSARNRSGGVGSVTFSWQVRRLAVTATRSRRRLVREPI